MNDNNQENVKSNAAIINRIYLLKLILCFNYKILFKCLYKNISIIMNGNNQ